MATSPDDEGRLDLRALDLRAGEVATRAIAVPPSTVVLGGSRYTLDVDGGEAACEVAHAHTGWHVRVRATGTLHGPCWRCLEESYVRLIVNTSDFARFERPAGAPFDEDLDSEYVVSGRLDAAGMARDGLLDGVPTPILCGDDCAGLCPTCGASLNTGRCGCEQTSVDSRWDGLRAIAERLERGDGGD